MTLVFLGTLTLLLFAAFIALGTWQIERRAWKLDLIARTNERVAAPAASLPPPSDWPAVTAERDAYRHVRASGAFLNDRETLVQAVTEKGSGFWVLTPLQTADGTTVLINRGFVPPERRDPATRAQGQIAGPVTVTGLLRVTEPKGAFLRSNDPKGDRWYSRDVAAIATSRGLDRVAPFFIDADATPNPGGYPVGGLTVIAFHNSHLVYVFTWYALALMVVGAAFYVVRDERRLRRGAEPGRS
nr:SURF1 family protein [Faunimonas pinastri]